MESKGALVTGGQLGCVKGPQEEIRPCRVADLLRCGEASEKEDENRSDKKTLHRGGKQRRL